jgi:hypothetical protein
MMVRLQLYRTSSNNDEVPLIKPKTIVIDFPRDFRVVGYELRLFGNEAPQDDHYVGNTTRVVRWGYKLGTVGNTRLD